MAALNVRLYECLACHKIAPWGPGWRSAMVFHRKGYNMWESTIEVCSDECEVRVTIKTHGRVFVDGKEIRVKE